jgi:hypothetical protein
LILGGSKNQLHASSVYFIPENASDPHCMDYDDKYNSEHICLSQTGYEKYVPQDYVLGGITN